jgi:hypothetical protein
MTGITITQSALTQDALKQAEGPVGAAYRELRELVRQAPVTYTDDTGWRVGGDGAYLMAFDTDQQIVYQIRRQHGNEQRCFPSRFRGCGNCGKWYRAITPEHW